MKLQVRIDSKLNSVLVLEHEEGVSEYPVSRLLLDSAYVSSAEEAKAELKEQLQLDHDFGTLFTIALDQQRKKERELDEVSRRLYKSYREELINSGIPDPKENRIKAEIVEHPDYRRAMDEKLEADKVADIVRFVVMRMLEDRRIILNKLAKDSNYHSW